MDNMYTHMLGIGIRTYSLRIGVLLLVDRALGDDLLFLLLLYNVC